MSKFAGIEDNPSLVRDNQTNAVLNVDNKSLQAYRRSREINKKKALEYDTITEDISSLKAELNEIKDLLVQMVKK
jgi:hypothetical protein